MALVRAEGSAQRFYSLSAQIQRERKQYDDQLEATDKPIAVSAVVACSLMSSSTRM